MSENTPKKINVTGHAVDRLIERFPELELKNRGEARRIINMLAQTGVILSLSEMKELAFNIGAKGVEFIYSPVLTAAMPIHLEDNAATVLTIYPAELRPEYQKLSQMLKIQALEGES